MVALPIGRGMQWLDPDLIWPVVGAIITGGVIGFEREYRSSPAGFRTHILVCVSSALLMLAAVHQIRWLTDTPIEIIRIDPVRMAHGVLTGIGFLCGGVIFREGFTVRGLTTAASLWSASSLGILFGVGFYGLAVLGALATLLVLAAVSLSEAVLPHRQYADVKVRFRRDAGIDAVEFRAALAEMGLRTRAVKQVMDDNAIELSATVSGYDEARGEALMRRFRNAPSMLRLECLPHDA